MGMYNSVVGNLLRPMDHSLETSHFVFWSTWTFREKSPPPKFNSKNTLKSYRNPIGKAKVFQSHHDFQGWSFLWNFRGCLSIFFWGVDAKQFWVSFRETPESFLTRWPDLSPQLDTFSETKPLFDNIGETMPWASSTIKIMVDPISMIKTLRVQQWWLY